MSKTTYNQATKPSAATVSRAKSQRLEIRDMPERWITDARFAIRADLVPKLADRFDKLGIDNEGNTTYPRLAPLVESAKERGWLSVSIELDTIGRGSAHESWYRLAGKTVVDSVYATYFSRILDGRKYGFAVSNVNPKTDPVLIIERKTETIVGMIMPAVGVNDGESSVEWMPVADAKPEPKPKQPKRFRLPKLPIRLDGRYITPEADDRIANNLQRRMAKELLKYANKHFFERIASIFCYNVFV